MLGVAGLLVIGVDRLRAALRPFNVLEDQPAALLLLLEVIGQAAAANDLGERLLQGLDNVPLGVGGFLKLFSENDVHGGLPIQ